jgi:hypothetical protein
VRNRKPEHRQKRAIARIRGLASLISTRAQLDKTMEATNPAMRAQVLELMRPGLAAHLKDYGL